MSTKSTKTTKKTLKRLSPSAKAGKPQVGPWSLVKSIGGGCFSEVFLAQPLNQSSQSSISDGSPAYVLKKLRSEHEQNKQAIATIRRESYVSSTVSHPRLVTSFSTHSAEAPYYLVMPFYQGESLATRLKRESTIDLPSAIWIARQVAQALTAMHNGGWIHCDIKPENIMLSPEGQVTLIDLAFARRIDEAKSVANQSLAGTLLYISPEMLSSSTMAAPAIDLYSLGATMYEMFSGKPPFAADDIPELVRKHKQSRPTSLKKYVPYIPTEVDELVQQLLSKQPLRRGNSASEISRRLMQLEISNFNQRFETLCSSSA